MTSGVQLVPRTFVTFIIGLLLAISSGSGADTKAGQPIPNGDVRNKRLVYGVCFYFTSESTNATLDKVKHLAMKWLPDAAVTPEDAPPPGTTFILCIEEKAPFKNFPVPKPSYFRYAGRGLSQQDIAALQNARKAIQLVLVAPKEAAWKDGQRFTQLALEFANETQAYLWDSATRECFSPTAWRTNRVDSWSEGNIPDIRKQITIHLYRANDDEPYLRAITLGMEKFALPDIVVEKLIGSDNTPGGSLINVVCQSLAENPLVTNSSAQVFQLRALQNKTIRANYERSTLHGAEMSSALTLLRARRDEGDPDNALIEIGFQNGKGKTVDERREDVLAKFWGSSDSVVKVRHTDDIMAASAQARRKLASFQPRFEKGLQPGERLLVKGPFTRDDEGNEWMWVEVTKWPPCGPIEGILQNDPYFIKNLKSGTQVQVKYADAFDYIFYSADGTKEGNETGRLMEQRTDASGTNRR
jgi:uncharacterized protein YegJ (DUF2314 family)